MTEFNRLTAWVGRAFNVDPDDIKGRCRKHRICVARHATMFAARRVLKMHPKDIAATMGMDRTSVNHGINTAKQRYKESLHVRAQLAAAVSEFKRTAK